MGLTIFSYLTIAVMIYLLTTIKSKTATSWLFRIATIESIISAACVVIAYTIADDHQFFALYLERSATALAIMSYLVYLAFAINYPNGKNILSSFIITTILSGLVIFVIVFTDFYMTDVKRVVNEIIRFEGDLYTLTTAITGLLGLMCPIIILIRSLYERSKVFQQQFQVISIGFFLSIIWGYFIVVLATNTRFQVMYPISGINGLFSFLACMYAYSSSRVFQWKTILGTVFIWIKVFVFFFIPAGLLTGFLYSFRESTPMSAFLGGIVLFLSFGLAASIYVQRRIGDERNEEFREKLESDIAHLDLSTGREKALAGLFDIISKTIGSSWMTFLTEDEDGGLHKIFPEESDHQLIAAKSPILETLSGMGRDVILKTDLYAVEELQMHRNALQTFFEITSAEAIMLAKEGSRVVGIYIFGPKKSGSDYDAMDYQILDSVRGKMFVVAYYARHVERESLLNTVEKEIGLADQIIKSIQRNIDPIVHPSVSIAYHCEASRGLGGDLFDAIKISDSRWFFVVGDISGKGLNASMSMIIFKSMIRTLLREEKDFENLIIRANSFIKERLPRGTFFSGIFGFLALDKGSIYFINCGIPAMFYRSPELDSVIEAQGEGKMLGFVRDIKPYIKTRKLILQPGSRVVISTDGIVEAESILGERYGKERLVRIIAENKKASSQELVNAIMKSASSFVGGKIDDDITIITIDYFGEQKTSSPKKIGHAHSKKIIPTKPKRSIK